MALRLPPAPVLLLAIVVPLLSMVPTWQGHLAESPPDRVFLGFRYMAADHFQYAAFIRQAEKDGTFLMKNLFTSEPQRGVYIFLYFWVLGSLSGLTGLSVTAMWEVFRVLGGTLYVLLFWTLAGHYIQPVRRRVFATALFALAGGMDWIITLLRATVLPAIKPLEHPFDYFWNWSTLGTMVVPNWIWPVCLITVFCIILMNRPRGWQAWTFILPPFVWLLHHYSAMVLYLALGLLPVMPLLVSAARIEALPWERARANLRLAAPGLASFALVAAYLMWARTDQVFALNAARTFEWKNNFSVWWYPLSYGLLLPLAWFGIGKVSREPTPERDMLLAWLAAAFTLSVNPLAAGVKYQYLIFPPLVLLAALGFYRLQEASPRVASTLKRGPVLAGLGLMLFLNAPVSLIKDARSARNESDIFMSADEIEAMKWLDGQPYGVVLCSYRSGHAMPWLSGKPVYIGHWFMTINLAEKNTAVSYFFAPQAPAAIKRRILRESGARYVFFGPSEAEMGQVDLSLPLKEVFANARVRVFELAGAL